MMEMVGTNQKQMDQDRHTVLLLDSQFHTSECFDVFGNSLEWNRTNSAGFLWTFMEEI